MKSAFFKGTTVVTAAIVMLSGGCSQESGSAISIEDQGISFIEPPALNANGVRNNGFQLNGFQLNGFQLNGTPLAGTVLLGVSTTSAAIGSTRIYSLGLDATSITGSDENNNVYSSAELIGAEMTGILNDGGNLPLRIDDVVRSAADEEILRYRVQYWNGSGWAPLCGTDNVGNDVYATPLSGTWDDTGAHNATTTALTFACEGGALAKCANFGYKPWKSVEECSPQQGCALVPVAEIHQACTRMLRADYCGDGVPHTQDGMLVNLWDNFDIQVADPTLPGFAVEADWTPNGARHIHHTRLGDSATTTYIQQNCPDRRLPADLSPSTFSTLDGFLTEPGKRMLLRNESALP